MGLWLLETYFSMSSHISNTITRGRISVYQAVPQIRPLEAVFQSIKPYPTTTWGRISGYQAVSHDHLRPYFSLSSRIQVHDISVYQAVSQSPTLPYFSLSSCIPVPDHSRPYFSLSSRIPVHKKKTNKKNSRPYFSLSSRIPVHAHLRPYFCLSSRIPRPLEAVFLSIKPYPTTTWGRISVY